MNIYKELSTDTNDDNILEQSQHRTQPPRIKFVTPCERHNGLDADILLDARAKKPLRWSGEIQDCNAIVTATLNPESPIKEAA